jgi:cysteine-rich repeat protein
MRVCFLVASCVLLGACFGPAYPVGLPCSENRTCPPGQTCDVDGICRVDPLDGLLDGGGPGPRCGDGTRDPGEVCDDGNSASGDGCRADCLSDETCGNGQRDGDEICDDGNTEDGDGCCACGPCAGCGNGVVDPEETCDEGGSTATCDADCTAVECGDNVHNPAAGEACDDGNDENLDLCTNECAVASCSDGLRNADEVDADCGGHCGPGACDIGQICGAPADCATSLCERNRCSAPTRIVFATSELFDGNLGGVAGADGHCQRLAEAAGLAGTYRAWLSDAVSGPVTRFTRSSTAYVLVDGTVIADDYTDLTDGSLDNQITLTELGTLAPAAFDNSCAGGTPTIFWSATGANGGPVPGVPSSLRCQEWTSTDGSAYWGNAALFSEPSWSLWCSGGDCAWHAPLLCFQQ